jgi:hypothetical protein
MHTNIDSLKRSLSRSEIRRRVAGAPTSAAVVLHMLKTIQHQRREIACLKKKLGC